jgi:thymidylate synthase
MQQYKQILRNILELGTWKPNRTGIDSIALPYPAVITAHMDDGFPILTGRKAPFKSAIGELCGFLRGVTSAADFRALGCKYWDQNANENTAWLANPFRKGEDDLGDVYGAQWRRWPAYKVLDVHKYSDLVNKLLREGWEAEGIMPFGPQSGDKIVLKKEIDQLGDCVRTILKDPNNRRILFHAWNPAKLDEIALPACHLLYQFLPNAVTKELSLSLTIRSNDMPLGWPSNFIEAAALLHLVARLTGFKPAYLTVVSNDAHIYRNQLDMVSEYLERPSHDLPKLHISGIVPTLKWFEENYTKDMVAEEAVKWLDRVEPDHFSIPDYKHGEPISAPMAV